MPLRSHSAIADYDIIVTVAGSRSYNDYSQFVRFLEDLLLRDEFLDHGPILFVSGKAHAGPDAMIIRWCDENGYDWVEFAADWDNINVPGALIRTNKFGKQYNAKAGHQRNRSMAEHSTHLILFWDGVSPGTRNMREEGNKLGLHVYTLLVHMDGTSHDDPSRTVTWQTDKQLNR